MTTKGTTLITSLLLAGLVAGCQHVKRKIGQAPLPPMPPETSVRIVSLEAQPRLTIRRINQGAAISWSHDGVDRLQTQEGGWWYAVPGATSPPVVLPADKPVELYRLVRNDPQPVANVTIHQNGAAPFQRRIEWRSQCADCSVVIFKQQSSRWIQVASLPQSVTNYIDTGATGFIRVRHKKQNVLSIN